MENKPLAILMLLVFIGIAVISYFVLKPKLTGIASFTEEKCLDLGDDCWHSLAHQTFNREYCLKMIDNETKEHCLEHIPEIKKTSATTP